MGIDGTSVEKYHLRTADAYRCAPAPAHSSPRNPSNIKSQSLLLRYPLQDSLLQYFLRRQQKREQSNVLDALPIGKGCNIFTDNYNFLKLSPDIISHNTAYSKFGVKLHFF